MSEFTLKQKLYIQNAKARWNFKTGATRSGKTYLDIVQIIPQRIRERIGLDGLIVIFGVTRETIERNVLEPMRRIYGQSLVGTINNRNQCFLFGEEAYCLGAEKISQVSKIRGASFKYAYGDEVADWNKEVFELLKSRLDKSYSCFDGSLNPADKYHWLKKFIGSDVDKYVQKYTIDDNPYLDAGFVQNLKNEYRGTVYYDRYILGEWVNAEGLIYKSFANNPESFLIEKAPLNIRFEYITIGVDWGENKSFHAFVASGITANGGAVYVLASERHAPKELTPRDVEKLLCGFTRKIYESYGQVDFIFCDHLQTMINGCRVALIAQGLPDSITIAAKSKVAERVSTTCRLLGGGRLKIVKGCDSLIEAMKTAMWDEKKNKDERLDDGTTDIDSLDAFEYSWSSFITLINNYSDYAV